MRPHQLAGSTYWNILRWAGSSQNVLGYSLLDGEVPLDSSHVPACVVISAGSAQSRCSYSLGLLTVVGSQASLLASTPGLCQG